MLERLHRLTQRLHLRYRLVDILIFMALLSTGYVLTAPQDPRALIQRCTCHLSTVS